MPFIDTSRQRATLLILLLGALILFALAPYASGLIGGLVLVVIFLPVHNWLSQRIPMRVSAGLMVALALVLLVVPTITFAGLVVDQAQSIASGVIRGPLLERLSQLRIGTVEVGPRLAGLGEKAIAWLGASAFGLLGHATRLGLNLTIALFILFYLLLRPIEIWAAVKPYIPFSPNSADLLRNRFRDVTISTVIGTGLVAVIQGACVALGFWATGLSNAVFWGVVTIVFAILPVVGSGLVWGPGALTLILQGRHGAALGLILIGVVLVGNVDVLIRPAVFRRFAQVHPLVTLVGAIGGVSYFGLLGILIGPLAISYFFELIRMYREEYLPPSKVDTGPGAGSS
jgi:predicted PurR-regulated permease PerM